MKLKSRFLVAAVAGMAIGGTYYLSFAAARSSAERWAAVRLELIDGSKGDDWPAYGRTYGEQHFSPLTQVNDRNVGQLGLAWSLDLPPGNSVTQPIAVKGVIYFATSYSKIHAVDAVTGKELWQYDPEVPKVAGGMLRLAWGSRGVAWWNGKIYTGTLDGRLIAIDAATGKLLWTVQTVKAGDGRYITGAPRVFDGKIIIGHGGADNASIRGYVTAYDAETGEQLWRFYTVPGNPADGFESDAMAMAAKTWFGRWWENGGGGTVWNAMTYDAETDTIFLGTGNGSPWNRKIRSQGKGDNLFLCSVIALDAKTGKYKWHYQINPGESWDYNAAMDMQLADIKIDGRPRKVLITAPKNGFFYVLDRTTGAFISAKPYVRVTWTSGIDQNTGRPIDVPNSRYETSPFLLAPSPPGAHNWLPMAYSRTSGLAYIPAVDQEAELSDQGIDIAHWRRQTNISVNGGVAGFVRAQPGKNVSALVAWDPVAQKQVWRMPQSANVSGAVAATAGNLVFQGALDGQFKAYDAKTGKVLWAFDAKAPVMAPPISYAANGRQYVTVITGAGSSLVLVGANLAQFNIDYRSQQRRVLTFAIGGKGTLPASPEFKFRAFDDPEYRPDPEAEARGYMNFAGHCLTCHGLDAIAAGTAPDLRSSQMILSPETFDAIVKDGGLLDHGMPAFADLSSEERSDIRQYVRSRALASRSGKGSR